MVKFILYFDNFTKPVLASFTSKFTSKQSKDNQSCLRDEQRLVSRQTCKGTVKVLAEEGPHRDKDIVVLP